MFSDESIIENYSNTITSQELQDHVYELASGKYEGRGTGQIGHNNASAYIRNAYSRDSLKSPVSIQDYFQSIPKGFLGDDINESQNIIAYIEGTEYPEEVIVISAHSDHLGINESGIHYGADDNASGTSAVIEMAQAFKMAEKDGYQPKRSIAFLHVTGEEIGLKGSKYYIDNPVFPLKNTVANLNIDMIGRSDPEHKDDENYVYIIGADRLSTELHYISEKANDKFTNLDLDYRLNSENDVNRYYYRSDHYNFAMHNIPVIFYFSGEHIDYHKTTDTPEKLNYDLLETRARLIFATAWYLANSEERITVDKIQ